MEAVGPLHGLHYNPEHVRLGGVLAPPYDVIGEAQREQLYGRDLRNIVRVDCGMEHPEDVPGENDRYTRAADFLRSWKELRILVRDEHPCMYVTDHEFSHPSGGTRHRRGLLAVVPAVPWDRSPLRRHESTLSGPKQDRLALLRGTGVQTSPVFALWSGAAIEEQLEAVMAGPPLLGGRTDGEMGPEKHLLWRACDPAMVESIQSGLAGATLYIADGHHRYETAVAYAEELQASAPAAPPGAAFRHCLVYLSAADDPSLLILPTHRLVLPRQGVAFSVDDLWARLDDAWEMDMAGSLEAAVEAAGSARATHHAFAVAGRDATAVLKLPRRLGGSPREGLDAVVLEREVLAPAGVDEAAIRGGALAYTRDAAEISRAVAAGEAVLGFGLQPVTPAEVVAVAAAGETMPQKSTYFYPKVPTGLVLHEVPAG